MYKRVEEFGSLHGGRLGRHVNHDPRSLRYAIRPRAAVAVTKDWPLHIPILDQGNLGSCTGNATTHALGCSPHFEALAPQIKAGLTLDESTAVRIYSEATVIDPYPGQYPPTDTGSDGVSVATAAMTDGLISGYTHALSLDAVITGLQSGPMITGINWYDSFDRPDGNGMIVISPNAIIRGGHELCVRRVDMENRLFWLPNSWSANWGVAGECGLSFDTMDRLLSEQGDATSLIPVSVPAPAPGPDSADVIFVRTAEKAVQRAKAYRVWKAAKGL